MGDFDTSVTHVGRGVTLIELLTVMAIISIVVGLPMVTMIQQRKQATLEEGQATVLNALATTRSRAIAGVGGLGVDSHVACVRSDEVSIYTLTNCPGDCSSCSNGDTFPLPPGVTSSVARIEFSRLSGDSSATTIDVSGFGKTRSVLVTDHGYIQ